MPERELLSKKQSPIISVANAAELLLYPINTAAGLQYPSGTLVYLKDTKTYYRLDRTSAGGAYAALSAVGASWFETGAGGIIPKTDMITNRFLLHTVVPDTYQLITQITGFVPQVEDINLCLYGSFLCTMMNGAAVANVKVRIREGVTDTIHATGRQAVYANGSTGSMAMERLRTFPVGVVMNPIILEVTADQPITMLALTADGYGFTLKVQEIILPV